jgi:hypothetical protein
MNPISGLLWTLGALTGVYVVGWSRAERGPGPLQVAVGAVSNFFDTLGIGSFATTTTAFRLWKMVPDQMIPGTLNVGHTLPTVAQAFIYTKLIPVDVLTLFSMIAAAVLGAWLGAGVVAQWPKRKIQVGMGSALLVAATLMLITQIQAATGSLFCRLAGRRSAFEAAARRGHRGQLHPRCVDDARDRPLRPLHDPRQPARHEPDGGIPDHDGIVRLPDARGQPPLHSRGRLQPSERTGPGDWRPPGGLVAALPRRLDEPHHRAVARHRSRAYTAIDAHRGFQRKGAGRGGPVKA